MAGLRRPADEASGDTNRHPRCVEHYRLMDDRSLLFCRRGTSVRWVRSWRAGLVLSILTQPVCRVPGVTFRLAVPGRRGLAMHFREQPSLRLALPGSRLWISLPDDQHSSRSR